MRFSTTLLVSGPGNLMLFARNSVVQGPLLSLKEFYFQLVITHSITSHILQCKPVNSTLLQAQPSRDCRHGQFLVLYCK